MSPDFRPSTFDFIQKQLSIIKGADYSRKRLCVNNATNAKSYITLLTACVPIFGTGKNSLCKQSKTN